MPAISPHRATPRSSLSLWMFVLGPISIVTVCLLSAKLAINPGEALTRNTIRLSLGWYAVSLCLRIRLGVAGRMVTTVGGRIARWCWTWACLAFAIHVAMAFHFYHGWSHADAFERTRLESGWGEGIYVSYLFLVIWLADVIWWWLQPLAYAQRPRWTERGLHAFMLFMIFNATIIYEEGPIRWVGIAMFLAFAVVWFRTRRTATPGDSNVDELDVNPSVENVPFE